MSWATLKEESNEETADSRSQVVRQTLSDFNPDNEPSEVQSIEESAAAAADVLSIPSDDGATKQLDKLQEDDKFQTAKIDLEEEFDSEEEMFDNEIAENELLKETIETYKEDFLTEHSERRLLAAEVNSLRQQVLLLQSELFAAREQAVKKSEALKETLQETEKLKEIIHKSRKKLSLALCDSKIDQSMTSMDCTIPEAQSGAPPSVSSSVTLAWHCDVCTFANPLERKEFCEMCGSVRRKTETKKNEGELESDHFDGNTGNIFRFISWSQNCSGSKRKRDTEVGYFRECLVAGLR